MPLSAVFQALSDGTRREILRLLSCHNLTAGAIAEHFTISKPSISHHLAILKQAGLVLCERQGQFMVYAINVRALQPAYDWMATLLQDQEAHRHV